MVGGHACPLSYLSSREAAAGRSQVQVILGYLRELEARLGYKNVKVEGGREGREKRGEERGQKRWGRGTKERQGC